MRFAQQRTSKHKPHSVSKRRRKREKRGWRELEREEG
jgi:hypothetical protein